MRFFIIAMAVASAVSVTANPSGSCRLDAFVPETYTSGTARGCKWWVCGQNNSYRLVRDCGIGSSCKIGSPTTCFAKNGQEF